MSGDLEDTFLTHRQKVRRVILKHRNQFPDLWENYTLVLLLVIREEGIFIPPDAIEAAARHELPNLTSVHRALTEIKKEFQTAEQEEASTTEEWNWREMMGRRLKEAE